MQTLNHKQDTFSPVIIFYNIFEVTVVSLYLLNARASSHIVASFLCSSLFSSIAASLFLIFRYFLQRHNFYFISFYLFYFIRELLIVAVPAVDVFLFHHHHHQSLLLPQSTENHSVFSFMQHYV